MTRKLVMLASVLSLVGCGAGDLRGDGSYGDDSGVGAGPAGPLIVSGGQGGSGPLPSGGAGQLPTAGTSYGGYAGSTAEGGVSNGDGEVGAGGEEIGGYGGISPGGGGVAQGGVSPGEGGASQGEVAGAGGEGESGGAGGFGGGDGSGLSCLANVAHCFDAAANCYAYSPGSDCDQIVDVCSDMQADCESTTP